MHMIHNRYASIVNCNDSKMKLLYYNLLGKISHYKKSPQIYISEVAMSNLTLNIVDGIRRIAWNQRTVGQQLGSKFKFVQHIRRYSMSP